MSAFAAVRSRAAALYAAIALLVAGGAYALARAPSSIFPEVTFPLVRVIADVGGQPVAQMIPTVTRPLEEAVRRVPGVQVVRSSTSRGSTEIDVHFAWGSDMRAALEGVRAEAQRVRPQLPASATIDVEWMSTATYPIEGYALTSSHETQAQLRDLAEYVVRPAILRVQGVAQVQVQGGREREFEVRLRREALEGRHLSASDVVGALRRDDRVLSAGLTEQHHELYLALVDGRVSDVGRLGALQIPVPGGAPARLSELGDIEIADAASYVRTSAGGHEAVLVNVVRQPSASTTRIAAAIDALVGARSKLLPADVSWSTFYDQAAFVSAAVGGVRDAIAAGVLLAGLVLLVFLRSWRAALVGVACLPVCVSIAGLALVTFGQTVNLMVMAGLAAALGLVADDAIVVVEHADRRAHAAAGAAADTGIRSIAKALLGSSLATTIVFAPFALLHGVAGAFFKPLAWTMAVTLVVSFFVARLAVPVSLDVAGVPRSRRPSRLASRWRSSRAAAAFARFGERSAGAYERAARAVVRHGRAAWLVLLALVAAAYALYRGLGTDFLPGMDEGSIIVDYFTPPGTALDDTDALMRNVDAVILSTPGVRTYSRRTGSQLGFFVTEPNTGDYVVNLAPRARRAPIDQVMADLRARIEATEPAVHVDFGQLLEDEIGDLTGGAPQPIDVKIFGSDLPSLHAEAREAARLVGQIPGIADVFDGITISGPTLEVRVNPSAQGRYGITTEDLHASVDPAIAGTVAGQVLVGEKTYDVRVFAKADQPLGQLLLRTPTHALVHLSDVASITTGRPQAEIDREGLRTYVGVTARLSGRSLGAAMADVKRRLGGALALGSGMSIEYGGLYAQQQTSFRELLLVLVAGLVLVAVVVLGLHGRWRAAVATFAASLATLAGSLGALLATGETLNVASFVGAIVTVGIAGENSIFVLHEGYGGLAGGLSSDEAWLRASRVRLRPVVMTTLATALALLPLALALGQGSQLMQPLAVAVIGGFLVSAPIVLLLVPAAMRA